MRLMRILARCSLPAVAVAQPAPSAQLLHRFDSSTEIPRRVHAFVSNYASPGGVFRDRGSNALAERLQ